EEVAPYADQHIAYLRKQHRKVSQKSILDEHTKSFSTWLKNQETVSKKVIRFMAKRKKQLPTTNGDWTSDSEDDESDSEKVKCEDERGHTVLAMVGKAIQGGTKSIWIGILYIKLQVEPIEKPFVAILAKNLSSYFLLTELTTDRNNAQILSIPTPIGSLPYLEELYLDDNQLSGSIPSSLNKLSHIRDFQIQ
ncbi:hypothetical protein RDABS01_026915, partial [Bienertia sinuspersici]